jgi:hypothetical protein
VVFKKGGKLKPTERQRMNGHNPEVVDKFDYLVVMLESIGVWNKQKGLPKIIHTMLL